MSYLSAHLIHDPGTRPGFVPGIKTDIDRPGQGKLLGVFLGDCAKRLVIDRSGGQGQRSENAFVNSGFNL